MEKYSIYIRVSTQKQLGSHLGIDAQTKICKDYITSVNGEVDKVFFDAESGKSRTRKGLWDAIGHCKLTGQTLVFAKLDRLARDVEFTFKVINTGINIHFVDMPVINTMILGVFSAVAQYERELISTRTKQGLAAKRKRDGSWTHEYGKNTGTTRADSWDKAMEKINETNHRKAMDNENNIRFAKWLALYESKHGVIDRHTDLDPIVEEVNALGYTTSTGKPFNKASLRQMIYRTHERNVQI